MTTIRIKARRYEDHDDCLAAAAADVAHERDLAGWDLNARWEDDQRVTILIDIPAHAARYQVRPIADANCASLGDEIILSTDDLRAAKAVAESNTYPFGAGIEDMQSGQIDVGYGFGIACPDQE